MPAGGSYRRGNSAWSDATPVPERVARTASTRSSVGLIASEWVLNGLLALTLFALVAIPFGASVSASNQSTPSLGLSPSTAASGTTVAVTGTGFGHTVVQLAWDLNPNGMPSAQANGTGTFKTTFVVPLGVTAGTHSISATSGPTVGSGNKTPVAGPVSAVAIFTALSIVGGAATASPAPTPLSTPARTLAPIVSATPAPTASFTASPAPTQTPAPRSTTTPAPTAAPTASPAPTRTAAPTLTPAPTAAPTSTPAPTAAPTSTPAPTSAPLSGISVTAYGAVGNGITDDTAAINRARDAAGVGGTLIFPPGLSYKVSALNPLQGQTWYGVGAHLLGPVEIYRSAVTLRGFEIGPVPQYGVYFNGVSATKLLGLNVHDTGNVAIFGENGVTDSVIDGNVVTGSSVSGIAIHAQATSANPGTRNRVTNNTVSASGQISIEIWSPGSVVQSNTTDGGDMGLSVGGAPGSDVGFNTVRHARYYGIELGNGYGSTVHDNTIEDTLGDAGVILDDTEHNSSVVGNTIRRSAQRAVQLSIGSKLNSVDSDVIVTYGLCGIETHAVDANTIINNGSASVVIIQ